MPGGKWPLSKELVAVFSIIILQKRVLDAGYFISSSHVWNDSTSCHRNLTYDHLYLLKTKSRKIIPNVAGEII